MTTSKLDIETNKLPSANATRLTRTPDKTSILIVDDHELARLGLSALLSDHPGIEILAMASSFEEALEHNKKHAPDVILLDLHLSEGLIIKRIPQLLDPRGKRKVLVITAANSNELHLDALRHGAVGIVTKCQPINTIVKAIRCVHGGEMWINREMTTSLFLNLRPGGQPPVGPRQHGLTAREYEIAKLAAQGLPAKKIGSALNICDKTVRNQLVSIYSKLGITGQLELAVKSNQLGLTEP